MERQGTQVKRPHLPTSHRVHWYFISLLIFIFIYPFLLGEEASSKLNRLRGWIVAQPLNVSHSTEPQTYMATLVTSLPEIGGVLLRCSFHFSDLLNSAYLLNLRGSDIPFNPLFQAYLFVSLESATLFVDAFKINEDIEQYLHSLYVERRDYGDLWQFLRRSEWGAGKVCSCLLAIPFTIVTCSLQILITPQTSFAISLMLTHLRYTVAPSFIEAMMAFHNKIELDGLRRAHLRDGLSFVRSCISCCRGC